MRYHQVQDGEWVKPRMKGYLLKCCDCGLVHRVHFKVIRHARGHKIMFRSWRLRKRKKKTKK